MVASPAPPRPPGLLRRPADYGQGVRRPSLHEGSAVGPARNQKTRGRFYLFLLYEVNRGLVHGTFFPGKGAVYVCRFLRRVRRWYPGQSVRIALDRDPAHPIKAQVTQSLMRRLRLNWTSLPKRSPDDNPCETIFSDIQQNLLDNSDDPDEWTTRRRISRHLRARN